MQTLHIFAYKSPIVTIRVGNAWVTNGHFKLVHIIDLTKYDALVQNIEQLKAEYVKDEEMHLVLDYHLNQIKDRLGELRDARARRARSINWIGSAWKWLAGTPDATDWSHLLETQTDIVQNNNQQYRINEKLIDTTREITDRINRIIGRFNNIVQEGETDKLKHDLLNKVLILKEGINEIVRACQMAKNGIVNSNLLDSEEVNAIVNELETLPYQNIVEAVEYGRPSVYSNGTLMLYILSIPKIKPEVYHLVTARAAIRNGKQIDLDYLRLLINHDETYGLDGKCLNIGNTSVCEEGVLRRLPEDSCLPKILKGGNALCDYRTTNDEVIELIGENTIFVTNFNGSLLNKNSSIPLEGTYLIQLDNDTVHIKDRTYYSKVAIGPQALPPVLVNVTSNRVKPNLEYVHDLSAKNIEHLNILKKNFNSSILTEIFIIIAVLTAICLLWKKIYGKTSIPELRLSLRRRPVPRATPRTSQEANDTSRNLNSSTCSASDLRDADI